MTQTAKLTASDGGMNDFLGVSIAISGNMVVLGAYGGTVFGGNSDHRVQPHVFSHSRLSGWTDMSCRAATLTASDGQAGDYFGGSGGNQRQYGRVVGAWGVTLGEGSAYVFTCAVGLHFGHRPENYIAR